MTELPFDNAPPPATSGLDLKSLVGCAAIFVIGGCHENMTTRFGEKPVTRGALVVLNGPDADAELIDVLFFGSRVVRATRESVGKAFVAHIDIDRTAQGEPVVLLDPTPDEYELARKWHERNPSRTAQLIHTMKITFEHAVRDQGNTMQTRPQQPAQQRSAPPTGPNYGKTNQAPSNPPPGPPPPARPADDDIPF